jgi:hypothetical protein
MEFLNIIGWFLVFWGLATLLLGIFRFGFLWKIGKIQGFVQLLGERGTQVFLAIVGLAALVGGVWLLLS